MVTRNEQLLAEAVRSRYLYVFLSGHQFVSIFIKKKKKKGFPLFPVKPDSVAEKKLYQQWTRLINNNEKKVKWLIPILIICPIFVNTN